MSTRFSPPPTVPPPQWPQHHSQILLSRRSLRSRNRVIFHHHTFIFFPLLTCLMQFRWCHHHLRWCQYPHPNPRVCEPLAKGRQRTVRCFHCKCYIFIKLHFECHWVACHVATTYSAIATYSWPVLSTTHYLETAWDCNCTSYSYFPVRLIFNVSF